MTGLRRRGHDRNIARTSLAVGGWTLVSRLTGFVRITCIAAVLGPTFYGNLFQTANQLPNIAFELVAGQLIASLLMPSLVARLDAGDRSGCERTAGGFLGVVILAFGATALVLAAGGPLVARALGLGIGDAAVRASIVRLGWPLLAVVTPQLVLYGLIGVASAVQNARGSFRIAAAAPAVENVVVVATVILASRRIGSTHDITTGRVADIVLLGVGSTVGVLAHAMLQWWGAWRVGVRLRPRAGWRDAEVRAIVRLAVPSLGLAALTAGQTIALLIVAGSVPGGVVAVQLGLTFVATAVALGARPVAVAVLPVLSRLRSQGDLAELRREYGRALVMVLFVTAPAALAMIGLAPALARAVSFGAMADGAATGLVTAALAGLGLAVLGEGVTSLTTQAAYAQLDTRSPLQAAVLRTTLLAAGLGLAMHSGQPVVVVGVAGASFGLATLLGGWFLHRATTARLPGAADALGGNTARSLVAAVGAAVPAAALASQMADASGLLGRVGPATGAGAVFAGGYVLAQRRLGGPDVTTMLRRRSTSAAPAVAGDAALAGTEAAAIAATSTAGPDAPVTGWATVVAAFVAALALGPVTVWTSPVSHLVLAAVLALTVGWHRPRLASCALALLAPMLTSADAFGSRTVVALGAGLVGVGAVARLALLARPGPSLARGRPAHGSRRWLIGPSAWAALGATTLAGAGAGLLIGTPGGAALFAVGLAGTALVILAGAADDADRVLVARLARRGTWLSLPALAAMAVAQGTVSPSRFAATALAIVVATTALRRARHASQLGAAPTPVALLVAVCATAGSLPMTLAAAVVAVAINERTYRRGAAAAAPPAPRPDLSGVGSAPATLASAP